MSPLTDQLLKEKLINQQQADAIEAELKQTNQKTEEELLIASGISEEAVFSAKARLLNIDLVKTPPEEISLEILETIPEETAKFYFTIPLGKKKMIFYWEWFILKILKPKKR